MKYAKVENGLVVAYPYTTLRIDHPQVSFPEPLADDVLAGFNVFPVHPTPQPACQWYQRAEDITPKMVDGAWVQQWQVIHLGADERDALVVKEWERVRGLRNGKLSGTDWTQLADSPVDRAAWATYRQSLRDLPQETTNPFEVVWPTEPR